MCGGVLGKLEETFYYRLYDRAVPIVPELVQLGHQPEPVPVRQVSAVR